jgi:hypothetical protein
VDAVSGGAGAVAAGGLARTPAVSGTSRQSPCRALRSQSSVVAARSKETIFGRVSDCARRRAKTDRGGGRRAHRSTSLKPTRRRSGHRLLRVGPRCPAIEREHSRSGGRSAGRCCSADARSKVAGRPAVDEQYMGSPPDRSGFRPKCGCVSGSRRPPVVGGWLGSAISPRGQAASAAPSSIEPLRGARLGRRTSFADDRTHRPLVACFPDVRLQHIESFLLQDPTKL